MDLTCISLRATMDMSPSHGYMAFSQEVTSTGWNIETTRKVSINLFFSLKMYVYQKVRARNFARAWGYIQVDQIFIKSKHLKDQL